MDQLKTFSCLTPDHNINRNKLIKKLKEIGYKNFDENKIYFGTNSIKTIVILGEVQNNAKDIIDLTEKLPYIQKLNNKNIKNNVESIQQNETIPIISADATDELIEMIKIKLLNFNKKILNLCNDKKKRSNLIDKNLEELIEEYKTLYIFTLLPYKDELSKNLINTLDTEIKNLNVEDLNIKEHNFTQECKINLISSMNILENRLDENIEKICNTYKNRDSRHLIERKI